MRPQQLEQFLDFAINHNFPVLIKAKPGVGKSSITEKVCKDKGVQLIITHPVVSDPTDYKGLPYAQGGKADFLPFGDLQRLIDATEPTVFFIDDMGQASTSVQAALMQLLLARQINGHKISSEVRFVAATNRKEDKAGVGGLLEPVKSRFASIVELEVNVEDWTLWAVQHNLPTELISFIRFKPEFLDKGEPSKDIVNSPSPRTIAFVGNMQNQGLSHEMEYEVFKGAAGEAFAVEYAAFLKICRELPSVEEILLDPKGTMVPQEAATKYALCGALSARANEMTTEPIIIYMDRVGPEFTVACLQDAIIRNRTAVARSKAFVDWSIKNSASLFGLN